MYLVRLLITVTFLFPQFAMAVQPILVAKLDPPSLSLKPASFSLQEKEKGMADGSLDGETVAEGITTGGKVGAGVAIGFLTGFIGTAIGVIGPESMTPIALEKYNEGNSDYKMGFKLGWDKKSRTKKRNAFLGGGALGTLAIVLVLVNAESN